MQSSFHPFISFSSLFGVDFFLQPFFFYNHRPMLHDFSVFLSTGFNDLCHYLQLLFVKSEFLVVHLAGTKEHSTLFFVSLFYFLNYFLILIFSIMLVTFSPIPI